MRKVVNGKEQPPFQRVEIPKDFPVYNQSHEISITAQGDHHIIKIDGQTMLDFHDDTFSSGSAGFKILVARCWLLVTRFLTRNQQRVTSNQ